MTFIQYFSAVSTFSSISNGFSLYIQKILSILAVSVYNKYDTNLFKKEKENSYVYD